MMLKSPGSAAITTPTVASWISRRGKAPSPRISSIAPVNASTADAAVSARNCRLAATSNDESAMPSQMPASVAATTAMPPPCGVGSLCEERAFGRASA